LCCRICLCHALQKYIIEAIRDYLLQEV
jgi:hypothetical protein